MPKFVHIEAASGWHEQFTVIEHLSSDTNIFLWPCALLLSAYLSSFPDLCRDSVIIELGAGKNILYKQ